MNGDEEFPPITNALLQLPFTYLEQEQENVAAEPLSCSLLATEANGTTATDFNDAKLRYILVGNSHVT